MTVPTFLTGMACGIFFTIGLYLILDKVSEMREEEEREIREAKMRQRKLREQMNAPREPLSQAIMDQAQKGLKRRDEG